CLVSVMIHNPPVVQDSIALADRTNRDVQLAHSSAEREPQTQGNAQTAPLASTQQALQHHVRLVKLVRSRSLVEIQHMVAGSYGPGGTNEQACAAGTYNTLTSQSTIAACIACAAGTSSNTPAASSASVCVACAAGTYTTSTGQTSCAQCPSGNQRRFL